MIVEILIWIFCICIIVIIPILGLIAFVYIVIYPSINAPIGGWKIESKLHHFECDVCPTPKNCRQCKRYRDSIKVNIIKMRKILR